MRGADDLSITKKSKNIPTFLKKTYQILMDEQNYRSVKWANSGIGFVVLDEEQFSKIVLPKFFKHSNYSSFVRQLNMYNFHKIREGGLESYFHHQLFDIKDKSLLAQIKRKPEKKRRKVDDSSEDEKNNQSEPIKVKRIIKGMNSTAKQSIKQSIKGTSCIKQSMKSIQQKKKTYENTRQVFHSQNDNQAHQLHPHPSQNIFSIEAQDDKMSINQGIAELCPHILTRQLINPSNNNLIPVNYSRPISNASLIL